MRWVYIYWDSYAVAKCNARLRSPPVLGDIRIRHTQAVLGDGWREPLAQREQEGEGNTRESERGRPVYSFCMCPGGQVRTTPNTKHSTSNPAKLCTFRPNPKPNPPIRNPEMCFVLHGLPHVWSLVGGHVHEHPSRCQISPIKRALYRP